MAVSVTHAVPISWTELFVSCMLGSRLAIVNPLQCRGDYSAISDNAKLIHGHLMDTCVGAFVSVQKCYVGEPRLSLIHGVDTQIFVMF